MYEDTFLDHSHNTNMTMACCAGLAMDLLKELMKDLKFDVDLFEIDDDKFPLGSVIIYMKCVLFEMCINIFFAY